MGPGSGTSPAISPDGSQVYAADGNGTLTAFDASTGEVRWHAADIESTALPSVGLMALSIRVSATIYTLRRWIR